MAHARDEMTKKFWMSLSSLSMATFSYLFLYVPILILIIFSFNAKSFPAPWDHFTFSWYHELFSTKEIWVSFSNSLVVATASTFLSLGMGVFLIFFRAAGGEIRKVIPLFYGNLIIPETMLAFYTYKKGRARVK